VLEFYTERAAIPDGPLLEILTSVGMQLGRVFERGQAQFALERHAAEIEKLVVTDELTGLHNRRGLLALAAPQLAHADRSGRPALLFFIDINGMQLINATLGHDAGDEALRAAAGLLCSTFREVDVLARLGGTFVAFAPSAGPDFVEAQRRLLVGLVDDYNAAAGGRPFRLAMSVGAALYDPQRPRPFEALLAEAEALIRDQKRRRKLVDATLPAPPLSRALGRAPAGLARQLAVMALVPNEPSEGGHARHQPPPADALAASFSCRANRKKSLGAASAIGFRPGSKLLPKRLRAVETAGVALLQAFRRGLDPAGTQPSTFFCGLDPVDRALDYVFLRPRPQSPLVEGSFGGVVTWVALVTFR
jgi:diguanylate cyclase (GGDEF)-like protein